jgi:hypothetical protein
VARRRERDPNEVVIPNSILGCGCVVLLVIFLAGVAVGYVLG